MRGGLGCGIAQAGGMASDGVPQVLNGATLNPGGVLDGQARCHEGTRGRANLERRHWQTLRKDLEQRDERKWVMSNVHASVLHGVVYFWNEN